MAYIDVEKGYFTPAQSDLNWAQTFRMTMRAPAVANRIFDTLAHMQNYINDTSQKASATPGLLLVVIGDTANNGANNGVYEVLTVKETAGGAAGTYRRVGEVLKNVSNWTTDLAPYTSPTAFLMNDTTNKTCYVFSVKEVIAGIKVNQYVEYPGGYYVREGNKNENDWLFGNWTQKVYSTTDGFDSALSSTSVNAVQNKVLKIILDNRAMVNGSYPNMAVGNIVPKETDKVVENGGFLFRSTAGNSSISDGEASLIKVIGNTSTDGTGVTISKIKSIGFNAFKPSNVVSGLGIVNGVIAAKASSKIAYVHVLRGIAQEGENNGYVISHKDGTPTIINVVGCHAIPAIGVSVYDAPYGLHFNSMSYLPPFDGYLAIEVPSDQDTSKLCVHLAWSGYRDGDYEDYWEEEKNLHADGNDIVLFSAGNVYDELSIEDEKIYSRVGNCLIGDCTWASSTETINGATHYIFTTIDLSAVIKGSTSNVFVNNSFPYSVVVNAVGTVKIDVGTSEVSISALNPYRIFYEKKTATSSDNVNVISYKVSDFGTEEFVHQADVIPGDVTIHYQPNLVDGLRYLLLKAITAVDSVLSTASTNPVENRVVTNELNKKAEKVGIFPGLVAGGLLAKDTDAINDDDSFLFRSSGGNASISDGDAKLVRVLGNVDLNAYAQESPFSAATFKSVGFNAFNPAKKYEGYVLNANGSISQQPGSTIIVVHVLNSTAGAGNNNGYDISTADGYTGTYGKISGSTAFRIGFSMTEYTGGTKNSGYAQIINRSTHYNSQSYLAPNSGYFIINTDGVDLDKLCVHLCWSGYRDNDFEEYVESKITLPYSQIHDWGLGKANAVADEINLNEAVGIKRVDRISLSDCVWTRHDNTVQEPNPDYDPEDPESPEYIDVTYTSYSTNSLAGIIKNSTLNVQSCELNFAISGIEYIGITVSNAGQVTLQLEAEEEWTDDEAPNRYLYYELAMPTQVNLEISPLYTVSDFGTEEFEDFTDFKFQCGRAYLLYLPNLIDGLRGLLARDLADAVKIVYVHELALTDIVITATISGTSKDLTYVSGEDITIGTAKYGKFVDSSSNEYYISITGAVLNATLNVYTSDGTSVTSVGSYTKANVKPKNVVPTWGINETADNTLFHLYNGATSGVMDLYYRYDANFFTYISVANHIEPNKFFIWTTALTTGQVLFVTFDGITNPDIYNEYMIQFPTGATIPTLSFPAGVKWNIAPDLDINVTYQVSIVNNIGLIAGGLE